MKISFRKCEKCWSFLCSRSFSSVVQNFFLSFFLYSCVEISSSLSCPGSGKGRRFITRDSERAKGISPLSLACCFSSTNVWHGLKLNVVKGRHGCGRLAFTLLSPLSPLLVCAVGTFGLSSFQSHQLRKKELHLLRV